MYEEWNFYPSEGKMNAQIKCIAPMKKIYGDDGIFRVERSMYKLKYDDVFALLYDKNNPAMWLSMFGNLWQSYFGVDSGKVIGHSVDSLGCWHATATRIIDTQEPDDTVTHFLKNEDDDTSLIELIVTGVENNEIPAWSVEHEPFGKRLTKARFAKLVAPEVDTEIIGDPNTNTEIIRYIRRDFDGTAVHKYKILEDWTFDPITGKTVVVIKGIAPIKDIINHKDIVIEKKTMFWLHYTDLRKILDRVEQYHPGNTFAMRIWDSYFISDVKPVYGDH
jgi:hypothetical protein